MINSAILEVAIGLVFLYLVLSTVSSQVKELIARFFDMRATALEKAIRNMLADPNSTLTGALMKSHLITGTAQPGAKPTYISSRNFALALFDFVAPATMGQSRTIDDLKKGVSKLPAVLQTAALGMLDDAQGDVNKARASVEHWFDDTMERVTGQYKRRANRYIAVIGLLLCAAVNADTLMIVHELWNDQALRGAVTAQAEARLRQPQNGETPASLKEALNSIRDTSVPPVGWASDGVRGLPHGLFPWGMKILGILISGVAVALGAPLWFDILNKFVNVRLNGNRPPDSREHAKS